MYFKDIETNKERLGEYVRNLKKNAAERLERVAKKIKAKKAAKKD